MKQAAKAATKPLAYSIQTKLDATFLSPSPVYLGQEGYSQSGRVRPRITEFVSVTVCGPGTLPLSAHASSTGSESHAALNTPPPPGPCP